MATNNPYSSFRNDKHRSAAMHSEHARDKSVARTWAAVVLVLGLGLICTRQVEAAAWLAALAAVLNLRR